MPEEQDEIVDWLNLPPGTNTVPLWAALHDAQIISIQSSLLERTVTLNLEIEHLRIFYQLPLDMQFILRLDGVQSARALRYSIWPGAFAVPAGVSREEEARLIAEYQSKWRQESVSWSELESAVTTECKQVIDISDATLAREPNGSVAIRIVGLFNYTIHHEVVLRATRLTISRTDAGEISVEELLKLGEGYWDAFERQEKENPQDSIGSDSGEKAT